MERESEKEKERREGEKKRGEVEREKKGRKGERTGKAPSRSYVPGMTEREIKKE